MNVSKLSLWDFAGFDGLVLARSLFGECVSDLSVFQSLETEWNGSVCAVLRLGETNFRVAFSVDRNADTLQRAAVGRRVWVKPGGLVSLALDDGPAWKRLVETGTAKPPHRLAGLPLNRAVPISLDGTAALVWRHSVHGVPKSELQIAPDRLEEICRLF